MSKPEIIRRPTMPPSELTLEQIERLIDRKIGQALKLSEERTHKTLSGFSARLFAQFPRKIAAAIEPLPGVTLDPAKVTESLMKVFEPDFKDTRQAWSNQTDCSRLS